jgi:Glycosyl transferase family 2
MNNHFAIVIPTRDRASTLFFSIASALRQDYDDLTVIVSDNASTDDTKEVVSAFSDARLKYINPGSRLSMAKHFEFALAHVDKGYVISIGDDDGLAVNAIATANEIINSEGTLAITSARAQYDWDGVNNNRDNQLMFSLKSGLERRTTKKYLDRVLNGNLAYQEIPIAYHGIVAATELAKLRQLQGKVFLSNQLDMYSALALSHLIPEYVHSRAPLVINGTSSRSNGASHFRQTKSTLEKSNWDRENDLHPLPPFEFLPSIKLLLAEAYMQLQQSNTMTPLVQFNLKSMLIEAYAEQLNMSRPDVADKIARIASHWEIDIGSAHPRVAMARLELILRRACRLAFTSLPNTSVLLDCSQFGVHDVAGAAELMNNILVYRTASKWQSKLRLNLSRLGLNASQHYQPR